MVSAASSARFFVSTSVCRCNTRVADFGENGRMDAGVAERYQFADFTEGRYREMLAAARRTYSFEPFGTTSRTPHVLWRHDIDLSPHRALRLAEIEAEAGVRATYFLYLHSEFYNLLEAEVFGRVQGILELGHWPGLHFDPSFYAIQRKGELIEKVRFERDLLTELLGRPVETLSFHNPTAWEEFVDDDRLAGMRNAYGRTISENYTYVSDSNGYWRHGRLPDVLAAAEKWRRHVLTHPEWWQAEPMSPRERLARCIEGRARRSEEWYDDQLRIWGRENIR